MLNILCRFLRKVNKPTINLSKKTAMPSNTQEKSESTNPSKKNKKIDKLQNLIKTQQNENKNKTLPDMSKLFKNEDTIGIKDIKSNIPEELLKVGLNKKKGIDDDMIKMYENLKSKGMGEVTEKILEKYLKEDKLKGSIIDNLLKPNQKKKPSTKEKKKIPDNESDDFEPEIGEALPEKEQHQNTQILKQFV